MRSNIYFYAIYFNDIRFHISWQETEIIRSKIFEFNSLCSRIEPGKILLMIPKHSFFRKILQIKDLFVHSK